MEQSDVAFVPDEAYQRSYGRFALQFATAFDAWTIRAASMPVRSAFGGTLGDILRGVQPPPVEEPADADNQVRLVWDLASLCSRFVVRDVLAWAHCLRRQGVDTDTVLARMAVRIADSEAAAQRSKWTPGLALVDFGRYDLYGVAPSVPKWVAEAWTIVVEEGVAEVIIDDWLPSALDRIAQRPADHPADTTEIEPQPTPGNPSQVTQERINAFIRCVRAETCYPFKRKELALLCGYSTRKELEQGRLSNATVQANVEPVLNYSAEVALSKLRARLKALKEKSELTTSATPAGREP